MRRSENIPLLFNCLKEHGGGSYNVHKGILNPTTGYMVAVPGHEKIIDMPVDAEAFWHQIIRYIAKHHTEVFAADNYLGVWRNPDTGKVYFDVSQRFGEKEEAMRIGRERGQIAIFNNETCETINIKFEYVLRMFTAANIHSIKTI